LYQQGTLIPQETVSNSNTGSRISFRWTYILLPLVILFATVVTAAFFYRLLPPELAYHFKSGAPDGWISRGAAVILINALQFVLALASAAVISLTFLFSGKQVEAGPVSKIVTIMGNIVIMPQLIIFFAMLDIFLYNSYGIHLLPLWVFALAVVVLGSAVLGVVFLKTIKQIRS
jgi:uncharacterized membrane protein